MNIILGFGVTEKDFEEQEFNFIENFIVEYAKAHKDFKDKGFHDEQFLLELNKAISLREKHYKKLNDEYKTAKEYPSRYSYYYPYIVHDWSNLCVVFKFHHVNRHHAFSPDGWALMCSNRVYYADLWDFV